MINTLSVLCAKIPGGEGHKIGALYLIDFKLSENVYMQTKLKFRVITDIPMPFIMNIQAVLQKLTG